MAADRAPDSRFLTTRWSVVLHAARSESTLAREALAHLCETYWYPLYAYVRRRAYSPDDALDMTQEFFTRLLEGNWVAQADPQRGRFRAFLLSSLKHFMANEWQKVRAQKRGGHGAVTSLDADDAEARYVNEPAAHEKWAPENLYERRWALTLLDKTLTQLADDYRLDGRADWFETMRPALTLDRGAISYSTLAAKLGIDESAARVAVHRLRRKYRQALRAEVANTVACEEDVDEEMAQLFKALAGG